MEELIFLQDMAIVMIISALTMILCNRLRLPVVLGYILAGLLVGPHTPPYPLITDIHSIQTLSALGVTFLLFTIGLEFSFSKLAKVGLVAFLASTFEIIVMISIGYWMGKLLGWKKMDSLFLGAILSISSTTIIAKILLESKKMKERFAQMILGILVIEDLWAIVIIAVLSGIAATGSFALMDVSFSMIKVFIFFVGVLFFGFLLIPRILRYVERLNNSEMVVIVTLGLCLGGALAAAKFGFSIALGAFLMGAVIAETKQAHEIITRMEPIRDMFTAIFFVSVGMLIEPSVIVTYAWPILIITLIIIIGKVLSCSLVTFLIGNDFKTSLKVGLGLAQIGEFSFIIAQLGRDTEVTSPFLYPIAVSVSALTTISTPFLMNKSDAIIDAIKRLTPKPILTIGALYPSWIARLGEKEVSERKRMIVFQNVIQALPKPFLYTLAIVATYFLANNIRVNFPIHDNIYWTVVTILIFPFFIGFANGVDKIIWEAIFLNVIKSRNEITKAEGARDILHNAVRFLVVFFSGLFFLVTAAKLIPVIPLAIAIITLVAASASFLWRSVNRVHRNIEKTIMSVLDYEKPLNKEKTQTAHDELINLIHSNYPLSFETQDFILPLNESVLTTTIRKLDLRSKTGASIVGIYREEETIPNPSPDTQLAAGDVLVLIGTQEQIKAAMQFLQKMIRPDD